jgi:anti-sigma-K factor RskA
MGNVKRSGDELGPGCGRGRTRLAPVVATLALAFLVAAVAKRAPPDFAASPIAAVHDASGHLLWAIRLAPAAHEIAVDVLHPAPPAPGHAYQLWAETPRGPRSLGLLPQTGRTIIPEMPAQAARLADKGVLLISLEPAAGSPLAQPTGLIVFRAAFPRR